MPSPQESLYVGRCLLSKFELQALRIKFAREQPCSSYDLLANNCNHFSERWVREITRNPHYELPGKITRMAALGDRVRCCLPQALTDPIPPHIKQQQEEDRAAAKKLRDELAAKRAASGARGPAYGYSTDFAASTSTPTAASASSSERANSAPANSSSSTTQARARKRMPSITVAGVREGSQSGSQRAGSSLRGNMVVPIVQSNQSAATAAAAAHLEAAARALETVDLTDSLSMLPSSSASSSSASASVALDSSDRLSNAGSASSWAGTGRRAPYVLPTAAIQQVIADSIIALHSPRPFTCFIFDIRLTASSR